MVVLADESSAALTASVTVVSNFGRLERIVVESEG
jgi:hypothetical protein